MFKINVFDRKYEKFEIVSFVKEDIVPLIDPIKNKLFHNDVFTLHDFTPLPIQNAQSNNFLSLTNQPLVVDFNEKRYKNPRIIQSPIREKCFFAGILVLSGNKTYGRKGLSTNVKKQEKLLYKCIPNDNFLPSFLVPYEMKTMGFSKQFTNLYVLFKYDHWEDRHPHGILLQTIGPVDKLSNFYEYQLYCKNLHVSIHKFEKETTKALQKIITNPPEKDLFDLLQKKYGNVIEDRTTDTNVFTIDPLGCVDFDDGFSIKTMIDNEDLSSNKTNVLLSIYISNVSILLDALQLWQSFGLRISTIYLPDKKRSMLPALLGDHLCSLKEKTVRVAFTMDVYLELGEENDPIQIKKINFKNTLIHVKKNFVYEEPSLLKNLNYQLVLDVVDRLSRLTLSPYLTKINDSHDLVTYLMLWMNHECSKKLAIFSNGIFRSSQSSLPKPKEKNDLLELFNMQIGKYVNLREAESKDELRHNALGLDTYLHITSPIRRLVDLLNMIKLQENLKMISLSSEAYLFYDNWVSKLDQINEQMKDIRRVQNQCTLLELCTNHPSTLEKKYEGYIFHREQKEVGMYLYNVFLTELKIFGKIVTPRLLEDYTNCLFQLYVFNDEQTFKKKIRLNLL